MNLILWGEGSSAAVPFTTILGPCSRLHSEFEHSVGKYRVTIGWQIDFLTHSKLLCSCGSVSQLHFVSLVHITVTKSELLNIQVSKSRDMNDMQAVSFTQSEDLCEQPDGITLDFSPNQSNSKTCSRTSFLYSTHSRNYHGRYFAVWLHFHPVILYSQFNLVASNLLHVWILASRFGLKFYFALKFFHRYVGKVTWNDFQTDIKKLPLFWSSLVPRPQFFCAISTWLLRTTIGGGVHSWPLGSLLFISLFMPLIIIPQR